MKYVTRAVVTIVEAIQWTGNNLQEVIAFVGEHHVGAIERRMDYPLKIRNRHTTNWVEVRRQHWIVKGPEDGVFTFLPPVVFQQTYQPVAEAEAAMGQYHGSSRYGAAIPSFIEGSPHHPGGEDFLSVLPPGWTEHVEAAKQAMRDLGCQIILTQRAFQKAGLLWPVPDPTISQEGEPTTEQA